MATSGQLIEGRSAIQEFIDIVMTPAYNLCQWWDSNNPGPHYMRQDHLGPRAVPLPPLSMNTGTVIEGHRLTRSFRDYAAWTGVYRRVRAGRQWSRWGTDKPHGSGYSGSATAIARLIYSYHWDSSGIQFSSGEVLIGSVYTQKLRNLRYSQTTAHGFTHDFRVCHDSCHNNCHGSRGRR